MRGNLSHSTTLIGFAATVIAVTLITGSPAGNLDEENHSRVFLSADPMCLFHGWVNDSVTLEGISGATVLFISTEDFWMNSTITNDTGHYELPANRTVLLFGCSMNGYLTYADIIDATGRSEYRLDIELVAEPTVPEVSATFDPDCNISARNPLMIDVVVQDFNLMAVEVLLGPVHNRTGDWLNFSLIAMGAALPSIGFSIGNMLFDFTYENDVFEGTCEWPARTSNAGYLVNDASRDYIAASFIAETYYETSYGFAGYYYNDTLSMEEGIAWFDNHTGVYEGFEFRNLTTGAPSLIPDAPPNDLSGEIATLVYVYPWGLNSTLTFEEMMYLNGSLTANERKSVIGLTFEYYETVPSGDYFVLLAAVDEAMNINGTVALITVDTERPLANAGGDQTVKQGEEVTLTGSGSDNVGIDNYTWVIEDGGTDVTKYGAVISHQFMESGEYVATLTVRDGGYNEDSDTILITVEHDGIPVAEAGPAELTVAEDVPVMFDGGESSDDGEIVGYSWEIVELEERFSGQTFTFTFVQPGVYQVELVVEDDSGQVSDPDTILVTVTDETAPTADAGSNISVLPGEIFTLDGSGSSDNVGITAYSWSCEENDAWQADGEEADTTLESEGIYTFTLEVSDAAGNTDSDEVTVYVHQNEPPMADAGLDFEVTTDETADFDASWSSDDVGIVNYSWTFEYDGETIELYGETAEFTFEIEGEYLVNLTVFDEQGLKGYDEIVVTVKERTAGTDYVPYSLAAAALIAAIVIATMIIRRRSRLKDSP